MVAVPLGVLLSRPAARRIAPLVIGLANIGQAAPSLGLLVLFFLLTGIALFVLRRRHPARPRPFRVPLYPLLPLLFCASCAYMLWSSLSYVSSQTLGGLNAAWIGVAVLAVGVVILLVLSRRESASAMARGVSPS